MEGWMAYVARGNPDHIWRNDRGLDLGDWLSVDAIKPDDETTPRILCATAYWAWCAQLMADMAQAIGRDADAARYTTLHGKIVAAAQKELLKPNGIAGTASPSNQVLPLPSGMTPPEQRAAPAAGGAGKRR